MSRALALLLAFAAAAVFYAHAWPSAPVAEPDTAGYLEVAEDLRDGQLSKLWSRPPGYPLLLLATGSAPAPGRTLFALQLGMHFAAVALLAALLVRLRSPRLLVVAFALVALLPPFVEHAAFALTETLVALLLTAGLVGLSWWLIGGAWLPLAGSAVALAGVGLVHPAYAVLAPALGFAVALGAVLPAATRGLRRRALPAVGALALATVVGPGGFAAHNALVLGTPGLSSMLGVTLSHKTVRLWDRIPDDGSGVREILIRERDALLTKPGADHLAYGAIYRALPELKRQTGLDELALDRLLVRVNLALIREAPLEYFDEVARSLVWYWSPGVTDLSSFGSGALGALWHLVRALVLLGFGVTVVLVAGPAVRFALAHAPSSEPEREDPLSSQFVVLGLACATIVLSMLLHAGLTAAVWRFRVPVDLWILASTGIAAQAASALARRMPLARTLPAG